ncbi:MAG: hypothetical protein IKM32_05395 [Clostridia bacterium]|nr:hypothetical protein [Clostridia bacterium]
MKSYFKHQLKSYSRAIIIITAITAMLCAILAGNAQPHEYSYLHVFLPTEVALFALCLIIPAWMFSPLKKKNCLDCCYSFSISKRALGLTHYLIGLIAVLVPFTAGYVCTLAVSAIRRIPISFNLYLLYHFLLAAVAITVVYSIAVFAFEKANSVFDGVVMIAVYMVALSIILDGAYSVYQGCVRLYFGHTIAETTGEDAIQYFKYYYTGFNSDNGMPQYYFYCLLGAFEDSAQKISETPLNEFFAEIQNTVWLCAWIGIGVLSAFGAVRGFDCKNAEKASEISDSVFAYKTLIPTVALTFAVGNGVFDDKTLYCGVATIACFIAYIVYRRSTRLKKADVAVISIMAIISACSPFLYKLLLSGTVFETV